MQRMQRLADIVGAAVIRRDMRQRILDAAFVRRRMPLVSIIRKLPRLLIGLEFVQQCRRLLMLCLRPPKTLVAQFVLSLRLQKILVPRLVARFALSLPLPAQLIRDLIAMLLPAQLIRDLIAMLLCCQS